jgi:hydrogenase large subunit
MAKAIATIAGQYPHNSYAIVGGVVCEPTVLDLVRVKIYIDEVIEFFEREVVRSDSNKLLKCENIEELFSKDGDLPMVIADIKKKGLQKVGRSYDRFIVFGENSYFERGKSLKTKITKNIDEKYIKEFKNKTSFAKNVLYKDKYYEVGPLSRAMLNKTPLIKDAHRKYGDSLLSRIVARVCEIPQLLNYSKKLLDEIELSEPSYIKPKIDILKHTGFGIGSVEAARGSLVHKVWLEHGNIKEYQIITPTQWNLSNGTKEIPGIAQKAMLGLKDENLAELVFKSFDICSVCTTH